MKCSVVSWVIAAFACAGLAVPVMAQDGFVLSSPVLSDGGALPADLKCTRDGGDGLTPPLQWSTVQDEAQTLALIMHHYPQRTIEGRDAPSQYWLLWNIPVQTRAIGRGNPTSIGDEGSDKDARTTGYTPPCSPPGRKHAYTITLYALSSPLDDLPACDSLQGDWSAMIAAMDGKVVESSSITFSN